MIAEIAPVVVIVLLTANVNHRIDRARSAEHLATGPVAAPVIDSWVGFGLVFPIYCRIEENPAIADWRLNPETTITTTGLKHQNSVVTVGAEPIGQHAARRTRANYDVVVFEFHLGISSKNEPGL